MFLKIIEKLCTIQVADLKFQLSLIVKTSLNFVKQKSKGFKKLGW